MKKRSVSLFILVLLALGFLPIVNAQEPITLVLSIPEILSPSFTTEIFHDFEAQHPGVHVVVSTSTTEAYLSTPANGLAQHLEDARRYVTSADVLYVDPYTLQAEATQAGYWLDLAPLANSDATLQPETFYAAAWESFQWDGGLWALPIAVKPITVIYDPAQFDKAGLSYPHSNWTLADFIQAARALAQYGEGNVVTVPGMLTQGNSSLLLRSLLGKAFYDSSVYPTVPRLNDPDLQVMLQTLADAQRAGIIQNSFGMQAWAVPLRIDSSGTLSTQSGVQDQTTLLPGGHAGLALDGFAVSGGTAYPELAYALVKYLSNNAQAANAFFNSTPARQTLPSTLSLPNDQQYALKQALPTSALRYADYVTTALERIANEGLDSGFALQEAELLALTNAQSARDLRGTAVLTVASPSPNTLGSNSLTFGIYETLWPLPTLEQIEQLFADFAVTDPQISQVEIIPPFSGDPSQADCYYMPGNNVQRMNLERVLNLDPFLDADPAFNKSDLVGTTLAQVQRENKTWAYPITLQPMVLMAERAAFAQAGLTLPDAQWEINRFADALHVLKMNSATAPFKPSTYVSNGLLMLVAAAGGLPFDYRSSPAVVNFTDPLTVAAIQQVLDLARAGEIHYQALTSLGGSPGQPAIYDTLLSTLTFWARSNGNQDYAITTYPAGSQYTPVSYSLSTAYINAATHYPEACYRLIRQIAAQPQLFGAMPAQRSLINDPLITGGQGPDALALYNTLDQVLTQPQTVVFPAQLPVNSFPSSFTEVYWLNRAFDNYVLHGADLLSELTSAQQYVQDYRQCAAAITQRDPLSLPHDDAYFRQFTDCAAQVDPSISALFPGQ